MMIRLPARFLLLRCSLWSSHRFTDTIEIHSSGLTSSVFHLISSVPRVQHVACSRCSRLHHSLCHTGTHAQTLRHVNAFRPTAPSTRMSGGCSGAKWVNRGETDWVNQQHMPPDPTLLDEKRTYTRTFIHGARGFSTAAAESSTLFLSSAATTEGTTAPVQVDLDLESRLSEKNVAELRENLVARQMDFNLDELLEDYKTFRAVDRVKTDLETERTDIANQMKALVKIKDGASEELSKQRAELQQRGKDIREQLKTIMPSWYEAEEKLILKALRLPADLHPDTPRDGDRVLQSSEGRLKSPADQPVSHLEFVEKLGLVKFSNVGPRAVYLLGEAAELEMLLMQHVMDTMRDAQLQHVTCPEFFRSVIVEGCGFNPKAADQILTLEPKEEDRSDPNAYHLVGASLLSYAAYLARVQVRKDHLPLQMFSLGRHYQPPAGSNYPGLYGAMQSNRVTVFSACRDASEATDVYSRFSELCWDTVKEIGLPTRLISVSPPGLRASESRRVEVQVWAPSLQRYVTVGGVSNHSDFVSRRLMCRQQPGGDYLHLVSGVAMDITRSLASVLEHSYSQGACQIPKLLRTT